MGSRELVSLPRARSVRGARRNPAAQGSPAGVGGALRRDPGFHHGADPQSPWPPMHLGPGGGGCAVRSAGVVGGADAAPARLIPDPVGTGLHAPARQAFEGPTASVEDGPRPGRHSAYLACSCRKPARGSGAVAPQTSPRNAVMSSAPLRAAPRAAESARPSPDRIDGATPAAAGWCSGPNCAGVAGPSPRGAAGC
jgi:hypothetical protein